MCPNFTVTFGFLDQLIELWVVTSFQLSHTKTAEDDKWLILHHLSLVLLMIKSVILHNLHLESDQKKKKNCAMAEVSPDAAVTHVSSPEYPPSSPTQRLGPPSFTNDSQTGSRARMRD